MLYAYIPREGGLTALSPDRPLEEAVWIDLYRPMPRQIELVEQLGVHVPSLEEMEEIEISNRLYREGDTAYMTAVLPGQMPDGHHAAMPVTFVLTPRQLVTVRHHAPRPFETLPERADRATVCPDSPHAVFVALIEETVARLADISEAAGRTLEATASHVFGAAVRPGELEGALRVTGRQAELMARVRLGLLTLDRIMSYYLLLLDGNPHHAALRQPVKAIQRDIHSLEVNADFLSGRVGLTLDATLGMINLQQNNTVRVLSVISALFLPPTLIASIYGMNFDNMPELHSPYGYYISLGLMLLTAIGTWLLLRMKRWL